MTSVFAAPLYAVAPLGAQIVNDGMTNTLSNATTNFPGDVTVGTNGSFTLLILSDNALLTNSVNGVIGRNATAKSNEVQLLSASARWRMGGSVFVGSNGASSRLVVSNGALLENNNGTLGSRIESSNNFALVSGNGTVWSNRNNLDIGGLGRGNQMIVSNGGWVASRTARLGVDASSSNNFVLVSGSGSVWSNATSLSVGNIAPSNRLVIDAGGLVYSDSGVVGDFNNASNNEAWVTGPGSLWTNASGLSIGSQMPGNRLVVSNGAAVRSGSGSLGVLNNSLLVTGAGSIWSNQTTLFLGSRADVSGGGWLACTDGYLTSSNSVVLSGPSGWRNLGSLLVGYFANGSTLIASNGATLLSSNALIGATTSLGNNNLALITDSGSVWTNLTSLDVGNFGVGNQLVISNGAVVRLGRSTIGANTSASSNSLTVTGPGSRFIGTSPLYVGSNGPANRLLISDGALVKSFGGYLGASASSTNNEAVVTGPGSVWIPSDLQIGSSGNFGHGGNRLVISDGGSVISQFTYIGLNSSNNEVVVTGPGSLWTETDRVFLGYGQGRNRLVVSNGGAFFSQGIIVGGDTALSTNTRVIVDGGTLQVTNGTLPLTTLGAGVLDIRHGTNVFNAGLVDVDQLLLTNTLGSFEFNGGTLVTRGATINNSFPFSTGISGTNPAVWDARAGSNYFIGDYLYIGTNTSFNQFFITNGAAVYCAGKGIVGYNSGANSNSATISGPGSIWSCGLDVLVGAFSSSNVVTVSNGGTLFTGRIGVIGSNGTTSDGNRLTVTGSGSLWTNAQYVWVGLVGTGNRLDVSDGGVVQSLYGTICEGSTAGGNVAQVTGSGSLWSNATTLAVGNFGHQGLLVSSNGGVVVAPDGITLGVTAASSNNRVVVDGGILRATNVFALGVLDVRRGTNVFNAGLIETDRLILTNTSGFFEFNGGALVARNSSVNNSQPLRVGNGVNPATLKLAGNGNHVFVSGLIVSSNATLLGSGTLGGPLTLQAGGLLSPGTSIGIIFIQSVNSPVLQGTMLMEISRSGANLTNDLFAVALSPLLTYGGTLTVANIGPDPLLAGDRFQLFSASSYSGSFASITLPPLAPGLTWTNKLLLNGSIEILGQQQPAFSNISLSGTNIIISGTNGPPNAPYAVLTATKITIPLSNWVSIVTNNFGLGGEFSFTNSIAPAEPQRYFRLRTP